MSHVSAMRRWYAGVRLAIRSGQYTGREWLRSESTGGESCKANELLCALGALPFDVRGEAVYAWAELLGVTLDEIKWIALDDAARRAAAKG